MQKEKSPKTRAEKAFDRAAEKRMREQVAKSEKYDQEHNLNGKGPIPPLTVGPLY